MIYVSADIHLERRLRNRELFSGDSFSAWLKLCQDILGDEASDKALILAGDVCDRNSITGAGLDVLSQGLDMLAEKGIPVYEIAGNHDSGRPTVPGTQGAINLNERLLHIGGFKVYGLDYRDPSILLKDLEKVPECDILVLHQAFQHLLAFEGATSLKWSDIPPQVRHVVCGDIHTTDVFEMSAGRYFVSPGSLHPTKVDEDGDHGYMMFNGSWKFRKIDTRGILRWKVLSDEDMRGLEDAVGGLPKDPLPVLESSCLSKYERRILDIPGVFHINTIIVEEEEGTEESSGNLNSTILDRLPDAVDRNQEPDIYSFLHRLFTENPDMVVEEKKQELLQEIS